MPITYNFNKNVFGTNHQRSVTECLKKLKSSKERTQKKLCSYVYGLDYISFCAVIFVHSFPKKKKLRYS